MTIAEVESARRRQLPPVYERARRRQMKQQGTRDALVAYLAPSQPKTYRTVAPHAAEHPHAPEWLVAVPAYLHGRSQLARVTTEHREAGLKAPSDIAYHRMLHVLRAVLAEDSVFPTMSIDDDGGIIAEWRIAKYALEVDVDPGGSFSYTVRHDGIRVSGGRSKTPLRKTIRDVSAVVAHVNPNWRSLFHNAPASSTR